MPIRYCNCGKPALTARKICGACAKRLYRLRNPLRSQYQIQKDNAKRRGKAFSLSFEQFCNFAKKYNYIQSKGITRESLHIDRIREDGGYTPDNIQVLPNHINVKKYLKYKYNDTQRKMQAHITVVKSTRYTGTSATLSQPPDKCPF
jgi:hypothetical protein